MLPPHAPPEYADRNILWNAVEAVEPNWNSQLAIRFVITLPMELSLEDNIALIREYCRKEFLEKGMIVDLLSQGVSELGRLEETLPEEIFVRKRIGKQLFLVRVHFKKEGTENLHTKICRMLEEEVRNSGYA